ncbi:sn-1-specific diacylglycerol lipase ABHD11-like isoform X2 [Parasteatoda tepidariorum]
MKLAFDVYKPNIKEETFLNPIVLLHSIMETKSTWKPIAQPLAQRTGRQVYAYDARNHGDSPWIGEYTMDALVDDLDKFLREHSFLKVILIGHSVGGKVAISFTLRNPERVEKLIVEDVPVRNFRHRLHNLVPTALKMVKLLIEDFKEINDRALAERHMRELAKRFSHLLVVTPERIDSYNIDCIPAKWNGNNYQLDVNIDVVVDSLRLNKLQSDLTGRYTGYALFIIGGASQFKA